MADLPSEAKNPQVVFSWKAPLRPYKKRSATIIHFYVAITLLLSLIVFFFGDKILMVPLWVVLFLFYVLTITPPPDITNSITQFGVYTRFILQYNKPYPPPKVPLHYSILALRFDL